MPKKQKITTIFEDDHLIVINKPAHVLSIPDRFNKDLFNASDFLKSKYENIFTIHRIDFETSGLLIFAKNEAAHRALSLQFDGRTVQKNYLALIDGRPISTKDKIDLPIGEIPSQKGKMRIDQKRGKPSVTNYEVIEQFKHFALVNIDMETGRTHQIRVHFQAIGHPLAVDKIYGRRSGLFLSSIKKYYKSNRNEEERPTVGRVSLHAHRLEVTHPVTEERVSFEAELPKDMNVMLKLLRKYDKK